MYVENTFADVRLVPHRTGNFTHIGCYFRNSALLFSVGLLSVFVFYLKRTTFLLAYLFFVLFCFFDQRFNSAPNLVATVESDGSRERLSPFSRPLRP